MAADDVDRLLSAACDNNVAFVRKLVMGGVPVTSANQVGMQALHVAAMYGSIEALMALLELGACALPARLRAPCCCAAAADRDGGALMPAGAPVSAQNQFGRTPLHYAAVAEQHALRLCKLLLKAGAETQVRKPAGCLAAVLSYPDLPRAGYGSEGLTAVGDDQQQGLARAAGRALA